MRTYWYTLQGAYWCKRKSRISTQLWHNKMTGNALRCVMYIFHRHVLRCFICWHKPCKTTKENHFSFYCKKRNVVHIRTLYMVSKWNRSYPLTSKPTPLPSDRFILPSFTYKSWMHIAFIYLIFYLMTRTAA